AMADSTQVSRSRSATPPVASSLATGTMTACSTWLFQWESTRAYRSCWVPAMGPSLSRAPLELGEPPGSWLPEISTGTGLPTLSRHSLRTVSAFCLGSGTASLDLPRFSIPTYSRPPILLQLPTSIATARQTLPQWAQIISTAPASLLFSLATAMLQTPTSYA